MYFIILDTTTSSSESSLTSITSVTTAKPIAKAVSPNRRKSRPSSTEVKEQDLVSNGNSGGNAGNGSNSNSNSTKQTKAPPPPPPRSSSTKANSSEPESNDPNTTNPQVDSSVTESDYVELNNSADLNNLKKGAPPPVAAKPVNVDIKSLTAKARQDALEQRHQELLSRQKALQEQYQRLQNMQKKPPTTSTSGGSGLTNGQYFISRSYELLKF